jgi:hypothetical protein
MLSHALLLILACSLSPMRTTVDGCPIECPPIPSSAIAGSLPLGITLLVTPGIPIPGSSEIGGCPSSCTLCLQQIAVQFSNNGNHDYCLTVDINGAGPSGPFKTYVKTGFLFARCDDTFCALLALTKCDGSGAPQGYQALYCLSCGCGS